MKQTAVEWLIEQWPILESQIPERILTEAKAMENQQQGYSEEEVKEFLHKIVFDILHKKEWFGVEEWFKQFKKK